MMSTSVTRAPPVLSLPTGTVPTAGPIDMRIAHLRDTPLPPPQPSRPLCQTTFMTKAPPVLSQPSGTVPAPGPEDVGTVHQEEAPQPLPQLSHPLHQTTSITGVPPVLALPSGIWPTIGPEGVGTTRMQKTPVPLPQTPHPLHQLNIQGCAPQVNLRSPATNRSQQDSDYDALDDDAPMDGALPQPQPVTIPPGMNLNMSESTESPMYLQPNTPSRPEPIHIETTCTLGSAQPPTLGNPSGKGRVGQPPQLSRPAQQGPNQHTSRFQELTRQALPLAAPTPPKDSDKCNNNTPFNNNNISTKVETPKSTLKYTSKRTKKRLKKEVGKLLNKQKYITNLSSKTLKPAHVEVLSLGLNFVPSRTTMKASLKESLDNFDRHHRIKYFYRTKPPTEPHPFKKKSTWMPPAASPEIEGYLKRVRTETNGLQPLKYTPNLTPTQQEALKELSTDQTLVIKSADKGSGIVVEDTEQYIKDGLDHLADKNVYERIETDPTKTLSEEINTYTEHMFQEGIIDPTTKDYLILPTEPPPRTQQLYFLKKIHKNPIAVRPIVSGCGGPTEKISQLVDHHLKPHIPKMQSYLKNSGDLISILENTPIPEPCTLATIDVKSLYLNIPHEEGIQAVLNRLYSTPEKTEKMSLPANVMSDLLRIVLEHNYFQFTDKMFHQIQGTAMGTIMAPSYANIFMAELEESLLKNYTKQPLLWKRYIDDILCIWPGPQQELDHFIQYLNEAHPTIKFTHESSVHSVDFLDVTIYKGSRYTSSHILDIQPFFKKTNKFQYLQFNSAHPRNIFTSLVKGELTRLLRACSNEQTYEHTTHKILQAFKDRGYPDDMLQRILQSVPFTNRTALLQQNKKENQPEQSTSFLKVNYTPSLNTSSLREILKPNHLEKNKMPNPRLCLTTPKNIHKSLVRAKLKQFQNPPTSKDPITIRKTKSEEGNSTPCGIKGCICCPNISQKCRVTSTSNYKTFPTQKYSSCSTGNIIYLIECTKCTKSNQYIGRSHEPLRTKLSQHISNSTSKTHFPLYKHFAERPDHNFRRDTRITVLQATTKARLPETEDNWIRAMNTTTERTHKLTT